jgi:hypothetical protein
MKKRMIFMIFVCMGCMPLFGQQGIWTTAEFGAAANNTPIISMSQVKAEILKFAGQYSFYTEFSGYSFEDGQGPVFKLELLLNNNEGLARAINAPLNGRQTVCCTFVHSYGYDMLVFHDGVITGGISTSNRRRLEPLIDQLIANCR